MWAWYIKWKETFIRNCATKLFLDKKKLWKEVEKVFHKEFIILKEKGKLLPDNNNISWNIFKFFGNIVNSPNIDDNLIGLIGKTIKIDLFLGTDKEYTNHPGKMKIKIKMNDTGNVFSFQLCSSKVQNKIQNLDSKKARHEKEIPLK